MLNKSENERSGVLSTAMSFLGLYRDPVVAQVTRRCDWRIGDIVGGVRPVTLYLVVPPSDINRTKPLIRLILNQVGRRLTEPSGVGLGVDGQRLQRRGACTTRTWSRDRLSAIVELHRRARVRLVLRQVVALQHSSVDGAVGGDGSCSETWLLVSGGRAAPVPSCKNCPCRIVLFMKSA